MASNDIRICGRYSQNSGDAADVMAASFIAGAAGGAPRVHARHARHPQVSE
jgi:anthranilate/para-aminobenzoate synthase component I